MPRKKRLKHALRHTCPRCQRDGKIRRYKTHAVFICICGVYIQKPNIDELRRKLDDGILGVRE